MPRVICRCGEKLKLPTECLEHINCPRCSARIRLRSGPPKENAADGDGFIRFLCPCGRRLKVPAEDAPKAGRCPDCGRVVPVPTSTFDNLNLTSGKNDAETRTQDLDASDLAELKKWSDRYRADSGQAQDDSVKLVLGYGSFGTGQRRARTSLRARYPERRLSNSRRAFGSARNARSPFTSVLIIVESAAYPSLAINLGEVDRTATMPRSQAFLPFRCLVASTRQSERKP